MRILLHNFVKVLWIKKIDIFFVIVKAKTLSLMKGQKDKKPGVKLLMVINVSLAFFVGRHPLGALLDFHLT